MQHSHWDILVYPSDSKGLVRFGKKVFYFCKNVKLGFVANGQHKGSSEIRAPISFVKILIVFAAI